MKIKVYGSRASMPFFSHDSVRVGGNTTCFKLEMNGRTMILDCGTGIMQYHAEVVKDRKNSPGAKGGLCFDILISHLHLDHIIGLSMFDFLLDKANKIRIFTRSRDNLPLADQIFGIFRPPYWPVSIAEMSRAELIEVSSNGSFALSEDIKVTTFESGHDNDTTAFRIEGEKTVAYLLDYEVTRDSPELADLAAFCENADVVIFDGTYLPEDYPAKRGWGHSTYEAGMMLAEMSRCKRMIFSHFYHGYSDETLAAAAEKTVGGSTEYLFAHDGMELEL